MADLIQGGVIQVGYDGELVTSGIAKNIKEVDRLPAALDNASKKGVKSLESLGNASKQAATDTDKAASSFENSLKRMVAKAQSGANINVELQKNLAKQFGNESLAAPYIAQINAAMRQNEAFAASARKTAEERITLEKQVTAAIATEQRYAAERFQAATGGNIAALKAAQQQRIDAFKGVDYSPAIKGLASVETAAAKAAFQLANGGQSAKQLGFALRNVPAQFSDIVVSLQGGQKPLTIFLQQGTQLKDLFGGAGNAARALGGYVLGLINPFSLAAGAAIGLGAAYASGANESTRLNTALITSGNIAGGTVGRFTALAGEVGKTTGKYGLAREAIEALAGSGVIAGRDIPNALKGIVAGATLTGKAVQDVTKDFEKLATDPLKGLIELNKTQNFLTVSTYEQVKALEKQGKTQEASTLAIKTYDEVLEARKGSVVKNLGIFEQMWGAVKKATDAAGDSIKNVGRPVINSDKLKEAAKTYADLLAPKNYATGESFGSKSQIAQALADVKKYNALVLAENKKAASEQAQASSNALKINALEFLDKAKLNASNLNKKDALAAAIEAKRREFAPSIEAFKNDIVKLNQVTKLRDQAIANLQANAAAPGARKAGGSGVVDDLARAYNSAREKASDFIRTQAEQIKQGEPLSAAQKLSAELLDLIGDKKNKLGLINENQLRLFSAEILANDAIITAEKERVKNLEDLKIAKQQYSDALGKSLETSYAAAQNEQERVDALQRQIDVFGLSEQAISALEAAKLLDAAATYEQNIANKVWHESEQETLKWGYAQIQMLKDRAEALKQFGVKTTELDGLKEAKKAAEELGKNNIARAREFSQALTNGLFESFKKGESFGKAMFRNLLALGKTWAARLLEGLVTGGGAGAAGGLASLFSGSANAAGGSIGGVQDVLKSGFGGLQDAFTGGKGLLDVFSGGNASIVGGIEKLGVLFANGSGGIADAIGGFLGANAGAISSALPYAGAVVQLLRGDIKSAALMAVGTVIGGPIGGAIGGLLGGLLGKKKITRFGSTVSGSYDGSSYADSGRNKFYDKDLGAGDALSSLNKSFSESIGAFNKGFGINDAFSVSSSQYQRGKSKKSGGFFSANINGQDFQLSVVGKKLSPEKVFEMLTDKVMGEGRAKAIQLSNVDAGIKSLFDGLTDKTQVNNMIVASLSLKETQIELANRFGLTVDAAGKVSVASGKAGDDLAKFAASIAAAGLSGRTVGTQLIKNRESLFADFNTVFGDVLTEAVLSTVSRQVEIPAQATKLGGAFGFSNQQDGLSSFFKSLPVKQFKTVTEQFTTFISRISSKNLALPKTLADYDSLLKNIDKTAAAGQKMFADVFALRDQFIAFTGAVDGLKGNVRGALFGIVSDAEKQQFLNQDLAKIFGELKIAVPGSVQELINLGQSIDYTTQSGLDLAAAFPSLVSAFKTTKEGVESLINSLRDESGFKTLYDFNFYKGIAGNYGNEFANRLNDGASVQYGASNNTAVAMPLNVASNNNNTITSSDPNMLNAMNVLISKVNALQTELVSIKANTKSSADTLIRVSPDGNSIQTKVAV